jgi:4-amino-4-deoxy-L-arabinose transferase-like glycosyltransferase
MTKTGANSWASKWLPVALFGLFAILAIGYSLAIPPGEGVDEIPHFDYIRYIKENRRLPIQPMSRQEGVEVWMGHHPPLYYLMGALAIAWSNTADFGQTFRPNPHFVWQENDGSNGWNVMLHFGQDRFPGEGSVLALYAVRFMTIGLGVVALYAVFRAARLMFGADSWLPLGVTALVAFNPSFVFMSSTVHHDTLQAAIFALSTWWVVSLLDNTDQHSGFFVIGGLLTGAAMLTKASGLVLVPVIGPALLLRAYRDRTWSWLLKRALLTFSVATFVAGWWYLRNQWLYGDPLGWRMFLNIHSHMVRVTPYTWDTFLHEFLGQISRTFWGGFGYMHITFPNVSKYLWYLAAAALVGLAIGLATRRFPYRRRWAEWLVIMVILVLLFMSFVRFSVATTGAGHARYLFPAAFTMAALIVVGLNGLLGWRHERGVSLAILVVLCAYAALLPALLVLPKYAPPPTISETDLPEQAKIVNLPVVEGLELVAYSPRIDRLVPGQNLSLMLYWRAVGDRQTRKDPKIELVLLDEDGTTLDSDMSWPVPSASPDVWQADRLYVSEAILHLPPDQLVSRASMTITPLMAEGGEFVEGEPLLVEEFIGSGGLSSADEFDIPNARTEVFVSEISLRGFAAPWSSVAPGTILPIDLYWEVLQKPSENYTVFIHVYDDANNLVAQYDRPAGGEAHPSSSWKKGQVLRDTYPLMIPEAVPAGRYQVRIGMYTWPSLTRLPISRDQSVVGDTVELFDLNVEP